MVKLLFNDFWYDLTNYIDLRSISIRKTGDKTLDSASFTIPQIRQVLAGIDVSRPFPRLARVTIKDDEFVLQTDSVVDLDGKYSHEVELVSVSKLLADTTSSGLTVTQLSSDLAFYYRSYSYYNGHFSSGTKTQVPFSLLENSSDTSEIDVRTMKKEKEYTINFKAVFYTTEIALESNGWYQNKFELIVEVGGAVLYQEEVAIKRRASILDLFGVGPYFRTQIAFSLPYGNVGTKEVKVYLKMINAGHGLGNMEVEDMKLSITTTTRERDETIYLAEVVEKILRKDANKQRFYLTESSKAALSVIPSYNWTLSPSYMWLHLTRVADYIKAFPTAHYGEVKYKMWQYIGIYSTAQPYGNTTFTTDITISTETQAMDFIEDYYPGYNIGFEVLVRDASNKYIYFRVVESNPRKGIIVDIVPFEDMAYEYEPVGITESGSQATIDDYAASIEINADNVYSEQNKITEITTLRSSGEITMISDDDIIVPTTQRIGEIVAMRVRIPVAITVGSITKSQGSWIDIDVNRILKQEYYNTLESMSIYNGGGRFAFSKNNCLFYVEGEKDIRGLGFVGLTTKEMVTTTTYIRGIYELIIAQLTRDNGDSGVDFTGSFDNGTVARDNQIAVEITYRPYTETNAVTYKSDLSGFQFKSSKFLNESATLNSPDVIGTYTQGIVDRSGGTIHSFNGYCRYEELPAVLTKWGDLVLFGVSFTFISWEKVSYKLQYIKDYAFISSYESYNPKERIYEVPKTNVQDRLIMKNEHIIFDVTRIYQSWNARDFVSHLSLLPDPNKIPRFARLTHDYTRKTVLPCVSQVFGRVVEFRVAMKDNYSAGLTKYIVGDKTYQKDFPYTNSFGRVKNTFVDFSPRMLFTPTIAQLNSMPNRDLMGLFDNPIGTSIGLDERKDARERSIYSLQFSYLSESDKIVIYDGIGKFSNVVSRAKEKELRWVEVTKLPARNQTMIVESTIIRDVSSVVLGVTEPNLTLTTTGANPVVCYDVQSGELLLGDSRKATTRTIYIRGMNQ